MGTPPPPGRGRWNHPRHREILKGLLLDLQLLFQNPPGMARNASGRGIGRVIFSKGWSGMGKAGFLIKTVKESISRTSKKR